MRSAKFSKILIFSICVLLVFAVCAGLLFNNGASLSANDNVMADLGEGADAVSGASYPVSADGYTHGSNVKNNTSAEAVNTASAFVSAIQNNKTIRLTGSFTLTSANVQSIWNNTYSGTIYGNGNKITVSFPTSGNGVSVTSSSHKAAYGGLCGKLTGAIYDLTFEHTGGQLNVRMTGNNSGFAGGLVGSIEGGTVENVKVILSSSNEGRVGFVKESSGSGISSTNYYVAAGALTGRISSGTVKNVTIINDAWIESGVTSGSGSTSVATLAPGHVGNVAGIIGPVQGEDWSGTVTLDNIIVEGTVSDSALKGDYVANIGTATTSNLNITVTNFYNRYKNTYTGNASSATFLKDNVSPSLTVSNLYQASGVTSGSRTDCTISNTVTVSSTDYAVGFDPKASNLSSSLVVVKSGVTGGEDYTATIQSAKGTTYSNNYAFSDDGSEVIFRNLSTTASDWNSNGNFACTINITLNSIEVTPVDDVNKWESSYTTSQSTSGVAVDNGSKLTTYINSNQNIYLTKDITDFSGFSHTGTYSGTLDGNGHTVYIVKSNAATTSIVGGLFGTFTGTVKNLRVVIYSDAVVTHSSAQYLGAIAGLLKGNATISNCYVLLPEGVTMALDSSGSGVGAIGAVAGGVGGESGNAANVSISNTTVEMNGTLRAKASYTFTGGFIGQINNGATSFSNVIFKGGSNASFEGTSSGEGVHIGGLGVIGGSATSVSVDGFVNSYLGAKTSNKSGYGVTFVRNGAAVLNPAMSNIYTYGENIANDGSATYGTPVDISGVKSEISTTVSESTVKVTPYFPAGSEYADYLVLVAGDGSTAAPDVAYGAYKGVADEYYKVVTVPKSQISAGSTVTLSEVLTPAEPVWTLSEWENGYAESNEVVPEGYTEVSDGTELARAIEANENIFLTADILDYVGFNSDNDTDSGYTGIFDGNGHTVYIVKTNTAAGQYVGGLFGILKGTVKNVRVVLTKDYLQTTNPNGEPAIGLIAGKIEGKDADSPAVVENVYAYVPSGVKLGFAKSSVSAKVGVIAGVSGANGVNISNTTVHLDGTLTASGSYVFISAFVGLSKADVAITIQFSDITFKGTGNFDSTESNSAEPAFMGITTIIAGDSNVSTYTLNGMINAFTGNIAASRWSMYGVLTKNFAGSGQGKWNTDNISNIYVYGDNVLEDKVYGSGYAVLGKNSYIDLSEKKSTIAATVADSDIPVTPYFPISSSGNLVLVAGDGTSECPSVTYGNTISVKNGNYMVVSVAKGDIPAKSTVELQLKSYVGEPSIATTEDELVYNGAPIDVTISQLTAGSVALTGDDYTVEITENGENALVQDGKPLNAGNYTLKVTLLNGYEFDGGVTEKTIEFTVAKKSLTIEGMSASERPYDGTTDVELTGGTLTGVASADESGVSFDATGVLSDASAGENKPVTVTAVLSGEKAGNYQLSAQPSVTVTITKASVEVSWGETTSFVYSGLAQAPTATATGVGQESVNITLTIKNAQSEVVQEGAVNAGSYTAEATTDNGNYTLTNATKPFEITRKPISVSVTVENWTYDETASVPSVSGNDGNGNETYLYVGQTNAGDEYSSVYAPSQAGTYTLTVTVEETQNYQSGEASAQFTVDKKQVARPQADGTSFTYNGLQQTYNPVGYDADTMTVEGNQQTNADTYQVGVSLKDTNNCEWATEGETIETFEFTIAKKTLTDNTQDVEGTYNATGYSLDITLEGFENGENLSTAGGIVKYGTEEGVYTLDSYSVKDATAAVTVYYQIVFANYVTVVGSGTITVNAKQIEVTWNDMSQTYTGAPLKPTATVSQDDIEGDDVVTVSVKTTSGEEEIEAVNVGVYTAVATTQNANYELTNATADNFEITAADFESAVNIAGWTYDDNANVPTVTYNPGNGAVTYVYNGTANDGTQLSDSQSAPKKAGSYTVTATIAANGNYAEKVVSNTFTIEKKEVEVPHAENKKYDGTLQNSGIVENEYYTVSDAGGTEVGPYTATLTLKDKDNYAWESGDTDNDGTVEVGYEIVAQDVHINSWVQAPSVKGWTYGGYSEENAPVYEATYGNDTAKVEFRLKSGSDSDYAEKEDLSTLGAGVYLMRVSIEAYISPEGGESYTGLSKVVEFTVAKASISVSVAIDGWTYGDEAKTPSVSGNTASGAETCSYEGIGDTVYAASEQVPVNAGTYRVTVTVDATDNYLGGSAYCDFTIDKKDVTATVSAAPATYDGMPHAANVVFEGNLVSDVLTATLLYNESDTVPVNAGSYTVTVGSYGGEAVNNYNIQTSGGEVVLVISAKVISVGNIELAPADENDDGVYDDEAHAVSASVSAAALCGEDVVTLKVLYNGNEDAPVNAGTYILTFEITDNGNYVIEEGASSELTVAQATVSVSGNDAAAAYNGEAFTQEEIVTAVFGGADLSKVNVSVTYRQGESAVNAGDIADVVISLKDAQNYKFEEETVTSYTFTVTTGTVSLEGENKTVAYRGKAYTADEIKNAVFGETNWENFTIKISYNNTQALNAGDVATLTVTGYVDPNYALDPEMTKTYTFAVTTLKVDAPALVEDSFVYNGDEQSVSLADGTYVAISENAKTDKGDYKAVATLKDKSNYEWATGGNADIELPWSITAKQITLKAETSVNKVYDGNAYDFGEYAVSGEEGFYSRDNVTVTVSAGEIYTPGSYGITVSHNANGNYDVTVEPTEAVLTIAKATLIITANPAEKEYTGNDLTFDFDIAGVIGVDDVSIDTVTYKKDGAIATPNAIGLYVAEFTLKGAHASYYNADSVEVTVKAPTTDAPDGMSADNIILPQGELFYDGQAHNATLDYNASDGNTYGLVYYFNGSPVENVVNAGTYTVRIFKNSQIYIIEGIEKQLTVLPRVLTADDINLPKYTSFVYNDGASFEIVATGKGVDGGNVTLKSLYDGKEEAPCNYKEGGYNVTFSSLDSNYTVADDVSVVMTILRKAIIKPVQYDLTYNGREQTAFALSDEYSAGGVFAATDVSENGYTATFTLANNNLKWSGEENEETREISVVWNIAPMSVEIAVSEEVVNTKVYDGNVVDAQTLEALFVAPDTALKDGKVAITVTVKDGVQVLGADKYTVYANVNDINYTASQAEATFTVTKADAKVEVEVQQKLLQQGDKLGTVLISLKDGSTAGTVEWENPDYELVKGDNIVTWIFLPEDENNYNGTSDSVTLFVGDEVLTGFELVSGPEKTVYNAFEKFEVAGIELKATFDDGTEQEVRTDECLITVENPSEDGGLTGATTKVIVAYGNMQVEIPVTVNRLEVAVPVLNVSQLEYNATAQSVSVEENALYTVIGGNEATDVGKYYVRVELTDKVNYVWTGGSDTERAIEWKITPVTLSGTITLPSNLVFDGSAKIADFTLTEGTLYGGAQMSIAYKLPDGTNLSGAPADAGIYDVVATLPDKTNYRFAEGTVYTVKMTIEKKAVTITTNGNREKTYDGLEVSAAQLAENFAVTDGLSVRVDVSGKVLNAGTYTVTATVDDKNYTAQPVSYTFTVRKATRSVNAVVQVEYKALSVTVEDGVVAEYSFDGNVWHKLDGKVGVELAASYTLWIRYAESENYNASEGVKYDRKINVASLKQYVQERFAGDITLADAADVTALEQLAAAAEGEDAEFSAALADLSAKKEVLVNNATAAVEKALKAGGGLKGYGVLAAMVAVTLGGLSAAAAIGLTVKTRKGGKKDEEK